MNEPPPEPVTAAPEPPPPVPPPATEPSASAPSAAEEKPAPAAPAPDEWREELRRVQALLGTAQGTLTALAGAVDELSRQVSYVPAQVRSLGEKVAGLATAIGESRYRALLLSVLGIHDLLAQLLEALPPEALPAGDAPHRQNYAGLHKQIRQILSTNGLTEIATDGAFNPNEHFAVKSVPAPSPEKAGRVCEVVRAGFRTETSVLRYAEVIVGQDAPKPAPTPEPPPLPDAPGITPPTLETKPL